MSNEAAESLTRIITSAPGRELAETPGALRLAAMDLLSAINTDPEGAALRAALRQTANQSPAKTIPTAQRQQRHEMVRIFFALLSAVGAGATIGRSGHEGVRDSPSTKEMQEAEADLRSHLPEIARKLPEVETAAEKILRDPKVRRAIERTSAIVKEAVGSKLSPFALLIVLWWVLGMASPNDVAALAVWYAIARDVYKKDKD